MIGNVVTAYCAGNRRTAWLARVDPSDVLTMLREVQRSPDVWITPDMKALNDPRARFEKVPESVKKIITGLFQRPREADSYGRALENVLVGKHGEPLASFWSQDFVALPAFGYARRSLRVLSDTSMQQAAFTHVPSICSQWNLAIAFMCAMSDLSRWSEALLPTNEASQVGGHPFKDQPWGASMAFERQLRSLWSMFALYLTQGSLLVAHANRRLCELSAQLRMGIDLRSKPALLAREENVATVYNQRLHPLVSVICRALYTGTIKTYHGVKDLIYCHGRVVANADGKRDLGEAVVLDALEEFGREKSDNWGDCLNVNTPDNTPAISLGVLARQLLSLGEWRESWDGIATKLGWTDISMNVGQLNQGGADFIVCDGTTYSHEPAAGLLGLVPVLSLGNIKYGGFDRRFEAAFALAADGTVNIEYSPMVVDGYQSGTGSAESLERLYIPSGMSMGETGTEPFGVTALLSDPMFGRVVGHFVGQSRQYVRQWYKDSTGIDVDGAVKTDWDTYVIADTETEANARLGLVYKGDTEAPNDTVYIYKDRFFHRFPVRRARKGAVDFYRVSGLFDTSLEQDGCVLFNDAELEQHSSADIEKIVNSASVAPSGTTAALPIPSDQVKEG
jgi:hypothetical protein